MDIPFCSAWPYRGGAKPSRSAMWLMHRSWAPRTVAPKVGDGALSPLSVSHPAYLTTGRALHPSSESAAFALRPSFASVARGRRWCDHDYPRWGGHSSFPSVATTSSCSAYRHLIGSEFPHSPTVRGSDSSL